MKQEKIFRVQETELGYESFVETSDINFAMKMTIEHCKKSNDICMEIYEMKNGRKHFIIGYNKRVGFYR